MTQLPNDTHIGYAHLRVINLNRALEFYRDALGMREVRRENSAVSLSATGADPVHLILTEQPNAIQKPKRSIGLYHIAIRLPSRQTLAETFRRLIECKVPFGGFSDHAVSEALYLDDPDGNGLELYRDRPRDQWRMMGDQVDMYTKPLDVDELLAEASDAPYSGIDPATDIGHVHLHVSSLESAEKFYVDTLGFDVMQRTYPGALFVAAGGYHHHIGLNTWAGTAAPPSDGVGLTAYSVVIPNMDTLETVVRQVEAAGSLIEGKDGRIFVRDQDGNRVELTQN